MLDGEQGADGAGERGASSVGGGLDEQLVGDHLVLPRHDEAGECFQLGGGLSVDRRAVEGVEGGRDVPFGAPLDLLLDPGSGEL